MCFIYTVENHNPKLGPKKGNKQAISVYDRNLGNRREIITTPEAAEEFISTRNEALKKANNISSGIFAGCIVLGAAIGAAIAGKKTADLGKLIEEKLNPRYAEKYQQALQEHVQKWGDKATFSNILPKMEVLDEEAFKKYSLKLMGLFSEAKNTFEKPKMKPALLEGGGIGALGGILVGLVPACIQPENTDAKITNEFIENNK